MIPQEKSEMKITELPYKIKYFAVCVDVCKKETEMTFYADKDGIYLECLICQQLYHIKGVIPPNFKKTGD